MTRDDPNREYEAGMAITGFKAFVIDTDTFSGNFERELCAFVTGQIGGCRAGEKLAIDVSVEIEHLEWWRRNIVQVPDRSGCLGPVAIAPTPGWFNNGWGGFFRDDDDDIAHAEAIMSAGNYHGKEIKKIQARIERKDFTLGWNLEACERSISDHRASIEKSRLKLCKNPAYLSVAIFVRCFPEKSVLQESTDRARSFVEDPRLPATCQFEYQKPNITGFRFVDFENGSLDVFGF